MGWQLRPELTGEELLTKLFDTAYITENGNKIINPNEFINSLR